MVPAVPPGEGRFGQFNSVLGSMCPQGRRRRRERERREELGPERGAGAICTAITLGIHAIGCTYCTTERVSDSSADSRSGFRIHETTLPPLPTDTREIPKPCLRKRSINPSTRTVLIVAAPCPSPSRPRSGPVLRSLIMIIPIFVRALIWHAQYSYSNAFSARLWSASARFT